MSTRRPAATLPRLPNGSTVTVGSFDGVHLGHQAVLREIDRRARAAGRASVLVTFDPHPLEVVNPGAAPPLLTTGPERLEILALSPLDYVLLVRFDRHLAGLTPEEFVQEVLLERCALRELVIGHDHGFGRGRSGDVETLRRLGASHGFEVDVVPPVDFGGQHVSSSRIRRAVAGGDLTTAGAMLGRRYGVVGPVGEGERRGRLLERCALRELVIGHDHGFGRGRSGDVETLRRLGASHGFEVDVVPPVDFGGQHVSSSRIRRAVAGGDLTTAGAMLGRRYGVVGPVGEGERRGRLLGVPTINLFELSPRKLLPPDGVYAVRVEWRGGSAGGMMNQGPRPTFQDGRRILEAHIFDFEGDLYGEWVRIEWIERLRDIQRFGSVEQLKQQLERDRARAVAALAAAHIGS